MFNELFKKINENMYLGKLFLYNFIKGGLMIGVAITIIELIYTSKYMLPFYAFVSASFFIVQLLQYEHVNYRSPDSTIPFMIHSILGGIVFVIYALILYYLHIFKVEPSIIIKILVLLYIVISILYYYLIKMKIIN